MNDWFDEDSLNDLFNREWIDKIKDSVYGTKNSQEMFEQLIEALSSSSNIEQTMTRILCYEIRERNRPAVDFVINDYAVKGLTFYLKIKRYDAIMYHFGYRFLLGILELFEEAKNYEECGEIKKQIDHHNILIRGDIPTQWKNAYLK